MSRPFIVVGDIVEHPPIKGGAVISGSKTTFIYGKEVARVGDPVFCGKHGPVEVATGDPTIIIDGQPVARDGDLTTCGGHLRALSPPPAQVRPFVGK